MILVKNIYSITNRFPKNEMYGISNQLRRASVSISSNIAERASRSSSLERRRFYEIARSSAVEIDTQLEIAISLKYIDEIDLIKIEEESLRVFKMLSGLIKSTVTKI